MSLPQIVETVARLSTEESAARLKVKPQTLRAAFCRNGHYLGCRPLKSANRFLLWPADEIERLTQGQTVQAREEAPCNN